tara:strand:+ start:26 stop:838 length:813 start_codon:yes stop_codon:yes gene_type:complete
MYTRRKILKGLGAVPLVCLCSCSTVPITDRKQATFLMSRARMNAMGQKAYSRFISRAELSQNAANVKMVRDIGANIQKAVEVYFESIGNFDVLKGYNWEYNLVKHDAKNAFCMPGGKVAVFSGLLEVTQNEDGLAVVMGHEIAHAVARHGAERLTRQTLVNLGSTALQTVLGVPASAQTVFDQIYGVGTALGTTLPNTRKQEEEADELGLIFMTLAGYRPEEAVNFWKRMAEASDVNRPEWLSTHPSDEKRKQNLAVLIPKVRRKYTKII